MLSFCPKYIVTLLLFISVLFLLASPVYADRIINSVTLNGSSSVTVAPSASITTAVNVTTTTSGGPNWNSTQWTVNGAPTCVDHANHTGAGTYSETFSITAPVSTGTYDASFIAYSNDTCSVGASSTYTLTGGIIVTSGTPTPTPTSVPGATPTPTPIPGQATPTPTPGASSTSSTYYPSVALASFSSPTNKTSLSFSGTASIQQGTISLVEYSITDGASWAQAQPTDGNFNGKDELFTFTIPNLAEGKYTVKVRAKSGAGVFTQSGSYASQTVIIATTPPQVTLDKISPNPTKNQTPTLTGRVATKLADVARVEVSLNNGKSWQIARQFGNTFSITFGKLEDGNYPVIARAIDGAGNIGQSGMQTLIIDTIPPIIGGGMLSLGPQILTPDRNGTVPIVAGADTTIAMSMKGGVTEAVIKTGSDVFKLSPKVGTNIWTGEIKFSNGGEKQLTISAIDGADNKTDRVFNTLTVEKSGIVQDKKTKQAIKDAKVSVYFFETVSGQWILWEAKSYGQNNPQKTGKNGDYSLMVPPGKYYLDVNAPGYNSMQSEIITVGQTSSLNYQFLLTSKLKIELNLPILGKVVLTLPSFSPPETFPTPKTSPKPETKVAEGFKPGTLAPDFALPNLQNKQVNLASFKGKKLLLTFISPWSSLSLEQAPFLSKASLNLAKNQAVLAVSLQESTAATQILMEKGSYKFPVVADKDGVTAAEYKVTILPYHVFIDATGKIQETFTGVLTDEELLKKLSNVP